jgi:hypothetical protein
MRAAASIAPIRNHPRGLSATGTYNRPRSGVNLRARFRVLHSGARAISIRLEVLVTACGRICLQRKRINVSTVLAGQRLGIKQVDDGIWIVSFMHYDLGYSDLEQRTLQPSDNPFGPGLSPMS